MLSQDVQGYLAVRRAMGLGIRGQATCCKGSQRFPTQRANTMSALKQQ